MLYIFVHLIDLVAILTFLLRLIRSGSYPRLTSTLRLAVVPLVLFQLYLFSLKEGNFCDFLGFWSGGRETLQCLDPYADASRAVQQACLNPPTALPLFALLATVPAEWSARAWSLVNLAGILVLVELCRRCLNAQAALTEVEADANRTISREETVGIMAVVALSNSSLVGLHTGQVSLLTAVSLLIALRAQAQGRPLLAGFALAVATTKVQTMLPFLILFVRKNDLRTWPFLIAGVTILCLAATPLSDLAHRLQEMLARINYHNAEGRVNDYSYSNTFRYDIISLSHVFYGLGIRDRKVIWIAQLTLIGILGAALTAEIAWRRRIARRAACSMVACFSMLFVYHRVHDAIILALPLVYATARAHSTRGLARWLFISTVVAVLLVMNLPAQVQSRIQGLSWLLGAFGGPVRAFVVPYAAWGTLAALACLWLAARLEARDRRAPEEPTSGHSPAVA
jgi:hypothetical protein